ncbi:MAG: hypothetical protein ACJAS1_004654 [Oleiphilaceae bacterium]|jgi:hypothetical protein
MVRMRGGSPKNMNQGIYWVQNATRGRRSSSRYSNEVIDFKLRYDVISFKLIAEDEHGQLPPRYANNWAKNNVKDAIELAQNFIKIIDDYYWLNKFIKNIEKEIIYLPDEPVHPCYEDVPEAIFVNKEKFTYKIPVLGAWLLSRAIYKREQRSFEIGKILNNNLEKRNNYNVSRKSFEDLVKINKLTDIDWGRNLGKIFELILMKVKLDKNRIYISNNVVELPHFTLTSSDKKTNGYGKNINRVLTKNKTKKELEFEIKSSYLLVACILCKYAYLRGYEQDITINFNIGENFKLSKDYVLSNAF